MRWGSEAPLIGLSELGELRVDKLLGVELSVLSPPVAPLLPQFFAVLFDIVTTSEQQGLRIVSWRGRSPEAHDRQFQHSDAPD